MLLESLIILKRSGLAAIPGPLDCKEYQLYLFMTLFFVHKLCMCLGCVGNGDKCFTLTREARQSVFLIVMWYCLVNGGNLEETTMSLRMNGLWMYTL